MQVRHKGRIVLIDQKDQHFPFLPRQRDQRTHHKEQNRPHSLSRLQANKTAEGFTHRQLPHLHHRQLLTVRAVHQRNALLLEICRAGKEDQSERAKLGRTDLVELIYIQASVDNQEAAV